MKKIILLNISLTLLLLAPLMVNGQLKYTSINYMTSIPLSDTKDFIGDASFRGFGFEAGKFVNENIAIGIGAAWNVFDESVTGELLQFGAVTVAGKQFRYINSFPIYVNASYYFSDEDAKIKPYAGLGVGTMIKNQRLEIGTVAIVDETWHFAIYPHAGLLFALNSDAHINLDFKYHQAFSTSDSDAVQYLSINVGLHYIFF